MHQNVRPSLDAVQEEKIRAPVFALVYTYDKISLRRRARSDKKAVKNISYVQVYVRLNLTAHEKKYTI